jgi:competence protein ComGC
MLSLVKEFFEFLMERKKFWLIPIIFLLVLLSVLLVMTQGSAISPFIYTLF